MSLSAVSERLEDRGHRVPPSTLGRIEQGKLDPGVPRLHMLLDLYRISPDLVSELIQLETVAGHAPLVVARDDLQELHDQGVKHWKSGDIAQGIAFLLAVLDHVPQTDEASVLRQQTALAFATAARNLGKYRLARYVVDGLLCEPPTPPVLVPALVLAASLWRGLGALEVAMGLIRQAETHLRGSSLSERAWVLHQKSRLLLDSGATEQAEEAVVQALKEYGKHGDTYGEVRAMVLQVAVLEAAKDQRRAVKTARAVIRLSEQHGHSRGVVYGRLELGRLFVKAGKVEQGIEQLAQGLSLAISLRDHNAEFVAHYHLWKAHLDRGDEERAALELETACYFVRYVDEHTPEVEEVRELARKEEQR